MKKIPQLYVKNSKGRYEEYKIPEHDISNTLYGKVNGRYEPVCMRICADIERFPLSKMGHIQKVAERIIDELRLGNTDTRVMTNNELVKLVVGLVYKYNEEV